MERSTHFWVNQLFLCPFAIALTVCLPGRVFHSGRPWKKGIPMVSHPNCHWIFGAPLPCEGTPTKSRHTFPFEHGEKSYRPWIERRWKMVETREPSGHGQCPTFAWQTILLTVQRSTLTGFGWMPPRLDISAIPSINLMANRRNMWRQKWTASLGEREKSKLWKDEWGHSLIPPRPSSNELKMGARTKEMRWIFQAFAGDLCRQVELCRNEQRLFSNICKDQSSGNFQVHSESAPSFNTA